VPVRHQPSELSGKASADAAMRRMERPFAQASLAALRLLLHRIDRLVPAIYMHNAKFDLHMLAADGVYFEHAEIVDTLVMARLGNTSRQSLALKALAVEDRLASGYDQAMAEAERAAERWIADELRRRGWRERGDANRTLAPSRYDWFWPVEMCCYAVQDVRLVARLQRRFTAELETNRQFDILRTEQALLPALVAMERRGMRIDRRYCHDALARIDDRLARLSERWRELTGLPFRPFHQDQVSEAFARLGVTAMGYTERGQVSWDASVLERLVARDPDDPAGQLAACVLEARRLHKLRETYFASYLTLADAEGVIHPDYQQIEALTGRMSCRTPNLQNVARDDPDDQDHGLSVRRSFIPRDGYWFVFCDWSQMELRLLAHASNCRAMIEALTRGEDLHRRTAFAIARVSGIDLASEPADVQAMWRARAKTIMFGVLYGMGVRRLADTLGITPEEAELLWRAFWDEYPEVREYGLRLRRQAEQHGYVENLFGRRYRVPEPTGDRADYRLYAVMNWVIQGSGADMAKRAMIRLHERLGELDAYLVAMIHDEFIFECPADVAAVDTLVRTARAAMTDFPGLRPPLRVPMVVDASVSERSWADKQRYDDWRAARL
jgi:DNA polymerase-1